MKKEDFIKGEWYVFASLKNSNPEYILRCDYIQNYRELWCDAYITLHNNSLHPLNGSLNLSKYQVYPATYNDLKDYIKKYPHLFSYRLNIFENIQVHGNNIEMCLKMSNHSNKSTKRYKLKW